MAIADTAKLASSKCGMVTSPHPLASEIGAKILARGGNAVEATIAMHFALFVVYPHFTGIGGDAFFVIAAPKQPAFGVSGIGQTGTTYPGPGRRFPDRGPKSMLTTACAVDACEKAYNLSNAHFGGSLSWASLVDDAIDLADAGFAISRSQVFFHDRDRSILIQQPGFAEQFEAAGSPLQSGQMLTQRDLANSLRLIADEGPRSFYEGALAKKIANGFDVLGSPLTFEDLKKTEAHLETPLKMAYRGGQVITLAPPTQGVTSLQIVGLLDHFSFEAIPEGSADYYQILIECSKRAFEDRNRWVCDPKFGDVPVDQMLSTEHLAKLRSTIRMDKGRFVRFEARTSDTVFFAAVDASGCSVSAQSSTYYPFGSGAILPGTGIIWHNRGLAFSMRPENHNVWQPSKRPFHTLNPAIYLEDGIPRIVYGTQGADVQPQAQACMLTRVLDYGMTASQAVSLPRFLVGRSYSEERAHVKLEVDAGQDVIAELNSRNQNLVAVSPRNFMMGQAGLICVSRDGSMSGAHDPRSDGLAIGL